MHSMLTTGGSIRSTSIERSQERLKIIRNRLEFDADSYHTVNQSSVGSLAYSSRPFLDHLNTSIADDSPVSFSPVKTNGSNSNPKKEKETVGQAENRRASGARSPSESSMVSEDTLGSGVVIGAGGGAKGSPSSPGKSTSVKSRVATTESRSKTLSESFSFRGQDGDNNLSRVPPSGGKGNEAKGISRMFSSMSMDGEKDRRSNGSASPLFKYAFHS